MRRGERAAGQGALSRSAVSDASRLERCLRWRAVSHLVLGVVGRCAGLSAAFVGAEHLRSSGGRWRASSEPGLGCVAPGAGRLAALAAQRLRFGGVRWQAVSQLALGEVRPGAGDRRP